MTFEIGDDLFSPDGKFRATILDIDPGDDTQIGQGTTLYIDKDGYEQMDYTDMLISKLYPRSK